MTRHNCLLTSGRFDLDTPQPFASDFLGVNPVSINIKASYRNGVLQPDEPLALNENEEVTIVVIRAVSRIRNATHQLQIAVDPELIREVAEAPELRCGVDE
ncbi:MAG: antitoxin family protein [Planctomycetaceae bacterium]